MNVLTLGVGYLGDEFRRHGCPVWDRRKFEMDAASRLRSDDGLYQFDAASLRRREGLYLGSGTMDLTKLKQHDTPTDLGDSVLGARRELSERARNGDCRAKGGAR